MRTNTKEIVRRFAEIFSVSDPILEVGALQVKGQEALGDLRPFFPGRRYVGCDMRAGQGVDQVENFEAQSSFADGQFPTIISLDTLEHVYDVFRFVQEIDRVLAPGGLLLLTSVMYYPIHAHPYDYWRFTPETFRRLTAGIGEPLILSQGEPDFPHTVVAVVRKGGALTAAERERMTRAVEEMPDTFEGCGWLHPRESAQQSELRALRAYHAQWGKVSASGFHDFTPDLWRRETANSAFDPNLSRWFYASLCWKESQWLGAPIWQIPTDLMALQELVMRIRPKTIVETGTNRGGSALFFASLLQFIHGDGGRVVSVDVTIPDDAKRRLSEHPLGRLVTWFEGSSTDPEIVTQMKETARTNGGPVLVFLDSDHRYAHVRDELKAYHELVSEGSYLVVFDTICRYLYDVPHGQPDWIEDNPLRAVQEFLMGNRGFVADRSCEKYMATFAPMGFLKRVRPMDHAGWMANRATLETVETAGETVLRCTTYEGEGGVWGGMMLGCEKANVCDGTTVSCQPDTPYTLSFAVRGTANWHGVRLALNVIDEQGRRLSETLVPLTDAWQAVAFSFHTGPETRHLGFHLVKARHPAPAVFEVKGVRL